MCGFGTILNGLLPLTSQRVTIPTASGRLIGLQLVPTVYVSGQTIVRYSIPPRPAREWQDGKHRMA
jgi:hypothetical protein